LIVVIIVSQLHLISTLLPGTHDEALILNAVD